MQALASQLFLQNTYVVFLSTNQVFDGNVAYRKAEERTCPLNAYGKQKAEFESWLLSQPQPASVLRLTKVITGQLPVLDKWIKALKNGESIVAFEDLVFAPLPLRQVLEGVAYLGSKQPSGIFQLSGARDVSYYEIACALAKRLGVDVSMVTRASAKAGGIKPQFLPRHGTLQPSKEFAHLPPADPFEVIFATPP
jgi:dTDP-4-dehydrorhamnose reductase